MTVSSPTTSGFHCPTGITISNSGTAFVTSGGDGTVYSFSTAAPPATIGSAIVTGFPSAGCNPQNGPQGIAISNDGATVFVTDATSNYIYSFPAAGPFPMIIGSPIVTGINEPTGITISDDGATAFVADLHGNIWSFSTAGPFPLSLTAPIVTGLNNPYGIALYHPFILHNRT